MSVYDTSAVWAYSGQTGGHLLLLLAIADGVAKGTGRAYRTRSALANATRLSERVTRAYTPELVADGELIVIPTPGHQSAYVIPIYPGEPGYEKYADDCRDGGHLCNGYHVPIDIHREDLIMRQSAGARARNRQASRERRGGSTDPGKGGSTDPDGSTDPGGRIYRSPQGGSTDPGGRIYRSPHNPTYPSDQPSVSNARDTPQLENMFSWGTAWDWAQSPDGRAYLRSQGVRDNSTLANSRLMELYRGAHTDE